MTLDKTEIAALVERLRNDHAPYWDRQASCARGPETARGYYQRVDQSLRAAALLTSLAEERERMREALEKARDQFRGYATLHHQKGTPDGDAKALTNASFADMCAAALSPEGATHD